MNYVEKARQLMLQTARRTALVIVPLAVAVPAVQAGPVTLPLTGSPTCQQAQSGSSGSTNCASLIGDSGLSGNALNGVSFFSQSGGISFNGSSGGGADAVTITDGGTLSGGTLSGSLPVDYNFQVSGGGSFNQWQLFMSLGSNAGWQDYGTTSFSGSFAGASSGSASGSGSITLLGTPISGSVYETVFLEVLVTSGSSMTLTFPFDFGPITTGVGTPEPSNVATLGTGLGLLGWLFRRRRKSR